MRFGLAALIVVASGAGAAAQQVDLVGTWSCSMAEYGSGGQASGTSDSVFNMALYRNGTWASSGRFANGSPYQGQGSWSFGRNLKGGMKISVDGKITSGVQLPEPFAFEADLEDNDAFSRISKRYGTTTSVECARMPAS